MLFPVSNDNSDFWNYLPVRLNEKFMGFSQLMLVGRVLTDGRLTARLKCDLIENLSLKANAQVMSMSILYGSVSFCHSSWAESQNCTFY